MVERSPTAPAARMFYVAHLAEGGGCSWMSSRGYALYAEPRTRGDVEADWAAARAAEDAALDAFDAARPRVVIPEFDEHWPGTRGEHRHAAAAAKAADQRWWDDRTAARKAAVAQCWAERGAHVVRLASGYLETCGAEYDDHAHADAGHALFVLHDEGCRCLCPSISYHEESFDQPARFAAYATPPVWVVTLDAAHLAARACGTAEFVTFNLEDLDARLDAVAAAHAATLDQRAAAKARLEKYLATTEEELDAMGFDEYGQCAAGVGFDLRGKRSAVWPIDRDQVNKDLAVWDERSAVHATEAARTTSGAERIWAIGGPLRGGLTSR